MTIRGVLLRSVLTLAVMSPVCLGLTGDPARAASALPPGFVQETVLSGLAAPTNIEFAADGRVFVAQKGGVIKVYDSLTDPTPDVFADLSAKVHNFWDRGLLGLALAPNFPADPWVYVLYTYDAKPGGNPPAWGDVCPDPPGATVDGCVVTGRLSRLQAANNHMTGPEQVLVTDWCQQFPSHSVGDLKFGADGALYASAGEGASFTYADHGQKGNPCGDPGGSAPTPPTSEAGALRAQDVRTTGDPTGLSGAVIRIDPATGEGLPGNPYHSSMNANARRISAYGMRNPFRLAVRPGTSEVWVGDTGWNTWDEINRVTPGANLGWPCFEGPARQPGYDAANLNLCESLYTAGGQTAPYFTYKHSAPVVPGENCPNGGGALSGLAFYPDTGSYPAEYRKALFFADYSRKCVWAMRAGPDGLPDPTRISTFVTEAANPVDLAVGPGGHVYYVDLNGGTVRRIRYFAANRPPVAALTATPDHGPAPLTVAFDAGGSTDPDGDPLTYQWDFQNDGTVDATGVTASFVYPTPGDRTAKLTVTDPAGASASTSTVVHPGNAPPTAVIDSPGGQLRWKVGETIAFTGHGTDPQDGTIPGNRLRWELILHHCDTAGECHAHPLQDFTGTGGSFVAPGHGYPSHLELRLTATDSTGLTGSTSVRLDPLTTDIRFESSPPGLQVTVGSATEATPFTRTMIVGTVESVSAPTPQALGDRSYAFANWSDGGAQTHSVTASGPATHTATYTAISGELGISGRALVDSTGKPLVGATVTLNPGGRSTTTTATGGYAFTGLTPDTYGVTVALGRGRCVTPATASVVLDAPKTVDVRVTARTDSYGHTCVDGALPFVPGTQRITLTRDNALATVNLPFAFPYYAQSYTRATVDTNGILSFGGTVSYPEHGSVPGTAAPNGAIYPFWRDFVLDASSAVLTASAPGAFTVEWRDVYVKGQPTRRVTFSVTLSPNGEIRLGYQGIDAQVDERGGTATVGIENQTGTAGVRYLYHDPVLRTDTSVVFRRP
ncbi:PQQ-dependent sugar dehydrogenase [Longispora sp. NPDC051575]|uniref:PQQ-dependent sugar dehydrogenase n=1 Tax=Longispora sp. NPDC051575 TaxID=3154943 RepID=UPI00341F3B5C